MVEVVTVGEILVEIMRKGTDVTLKEASNFVGPFPSGAPAIFTDAIARLDHESGIVGGVGYDEFGECVLNRLGNDGVNLEAIKKSEDLSTGVAFVTYFSDGSRKFIYHLENSAAGVIDADDVKEDYFKGASILHLNGCSLTMGEKMREGCYKAVEIAHDNGLLVSLDPNIRVELEGAEGSREIIEPVLKSADIIIPTEEELQGITGVENVDEAVNKLVDSGVELTALKKGSEGCEIFTEGKSLKIPPFEVEEIDPTGAGDAFSAGIVVGRIEGMSLRKMGTFANAVGARAVAKKGPMEGLARRSEIDKMIR